MCPMGEVLFACLGFACAALLIGLAVVGLRDRRRNIKPDLLPDGLREQLGLWSNRNYRQGARVGEGAFLSPQFLNSRRIGLTIFIASLILLIAGLLVVQGLSGGTSGFVPKHAWLPRGVDGRTFKPAGLGLAVDVPSDWAASPPANGFDYVLRDADTGDFLLASKFQSMNALSPTAFLDQRRAFLVGRGAAINDALVGTIQGHPAVRIRYRLPGQDDGRAADDVEYDVLLTPTASAIVVVGASAGHTDPNLVAWITSTIHPST